MVPLPGFDLQNEIRRVQVQVRPNQGDLHVGGCVAGIVNLDDGITTALRPGDAVRNRVRIVPRKCESLIPNGGGIRVNSG